MRLGIVISLLLHAGIIAWAVSSINATNPADTLYDKPITVDIMNVSELTKVKAGSETAKKPKPKVDARTKPKPKKKEVARPTVESKPKKVAAMPPPQVDPKVAPKSKPEKTEKPEEKSIAAIPRRKPKPPRAKPKKKKKKVAAKKRKTPPTKTKKQFDADSIAALLNKIPDAKPAKRPEPKRMAEVATIKPPDYGQFDGTDNELSRSEFNFFMRQIGNCWNPPVGAASAQHLIPVLSFRLLPDGTLDGAPRVVNHQASPFFLAAADAAVRAVVACAPYSLPKEKYKDWASNEITFDPQSMFGG